MKRSWVFALIWIPLAGCTQLAGTLSESAVPRSLWQERQQQLETVSTWNLRGRLAVRVGSQSDNFSFVWQGNSNSEELKLFGPFGGGRLHIYQDAGGIVLKDGSGQELQGKTADEVLSVVSAWPIPFMQMSYWVRGLPAPGGHDSIGFDYVGRVRSLTQNGWKIEYSEYRAFDGIDLPKRMAITTWLSDQEYGETVSVKLSIGSWVYNFKSG